MIMNVRKNDEGIRITNIDWRRILFGFLALSILGVGVDCFVTRQLWTGIFLIAFGLFITGLAMKYAEWSDFRFIVGSRVLVWKRLTVFHRERGRIPFEDIQGADVEFRIVRGYEGIGEEAYRMVLHTTTGIVPVNTWPAIVIFDGRRFCAARTAINDILEIARPPDDLQTLADLYMRGKIDEAMKLGKQMRCMSDGKTRKWIKQLVVDRKTNADGKEATAV